MTKATTTSSCTAAAAAAAAAPVQRVMTQLVLLSVVLLLTSTSIRTGGVNAEKPKVVHRKGVVPDGVVQLTRDTFRSAIVEDNVANPFWLLKFYAPWCGHCKKLAPVLDDVAPKLKGKMAIGTIDCTVEKKLCEDYKVRGYPTLMFSLDGSVHDYPGGRSAKDFLSFAEKMNQQSITAVTSVKQAYEKLNDIGESDGDGVAFLAYHPAVVAEMSEDEIPKKMDDKLQASLLTQVYGQVARKEKAYNTFYLLDKKDEEGYESLKGGTEPFVCRIESGGVPPKCYTDTDAANSPNAVAEMRDFVRTNSIATVTMLGPANWQKVGKNGKPLMIGVVDKTNPEQVDTAKRQLMKYAVDGPDDSRDAYYYGIFDGKVFYKFLEQFDVMSDQLPQLLLLDVPTRMYCQNATYGLNVDDFVNAVNDGTIQYKRAGASGIKGFLKQFLYFVQENRPWSVIALVIAFMAFTVTILSVLSPGDDADQPRRGKPYSPEEPLLVPSTQMPPLPSDKKKKQEGSNAAGKATETSSSSGKEEPKKEK